MENRGVMKLIDKRFWIFEAFTLLYAVGLMLLGYLIYGNSSVMGFQLLIVSLCCMSGLVTWLIANGKHWLLFGLVYECVLLFLISVCLWLLTDPKEPSLDFYMFIGTAIMTIAIYTIIPSFILAFCGYRLFQSKEKNESRVNS